MATVVIVHAAEDGLPARALAEKLRAAKLTVVVERQPGDETREAVKNANVTIALWSPRSHGLAAMSEDVAFARTKSKLVHARMQNAQVPTAFSGDKAVDLTGWRGEDDFPAWRELAKAVTERAGVAAMPPPAQRPTSGFFQPAPNAASPGAEASMAQLAAMGKQRAESQAPSQPQQRAPAPRAPAPPARPAASQAPPQRVAPPREGPPARTYSPEPEPARGGGLGMIAIVAFLVVAALGGGGYFFWSQQQSAQSATSAWDDIDHNDASALRAFIAANPAGHRDEAEAALTQLEEQSFDAARDADTIEAFEGFLRDFPQSSHALEARGRIAELRSLPDQTVPPDQATTTTELAPPAADPDLLPPGATTTAPATGPAPTSEGPATLTPPPAPAAPPAGDATQPPTN